MAEDKIREVIDKVKSGDIGLAPSELATDRTDEGEKISSAKKKKMCDPCNIGKHPECEGDLVCGCDHPMHRPQTGGQAH
jgi:hypothetical protein